MSSEQNDFEKLLSGGAPQVPENTELSAPPVVNDPVAETAPPVEEQPPQVEANEVKDEPENPLQSELEKLKQELEKERRDKLAITNKVAPIQRKLAEFERAQRQAIPPNAAQRADLQSNKPNPSDDPWKELVEGLGEADALPIKRTLEKVLSPVLESIKAKDAEIANLRAFIDTEITPVVHETRTDRNKSKLSDFHSDWHQINDDPTYWDFIDALPQNVRDNLDLENSVEDCAFAIGLFKQSKPAQAPEPKASETAEKRKARLAAAVVPNVAQNANQTTPTNRQELFEHLLNS